MKRHLIVTLILISFICGKSYGQIGAIAARAYKQDTLRTHSFSSGLGVLFYLSDNEMDKRATFRFANSAHVNYLFDTADVELNLRQIVERDKNGAWDSNHLLLLSTGIFKYKPLDDHTRVMRAFHLEPIFIYQNNSDRGLRRRFQLGALIHPWGFVRPKFKLNVGVGAVYDWSSWEVNDMQKIDAASPELREKVLFINSRIKMRKNMYQDYSEWRPMLLLTLNYELSETLSLNLSTSYQQSLSSPYSREIREAYPDLKKVYPYILTQFDIKVKLRKGFALTLSTTVDYENSNLSLYESSWSYNTLVGVTWDFSSQKIR